MTWNYRVIHEDGTYSIREVYYSATGEAEAVSACPCSPSGETLEELRDDLDRMSGAMALPFIDYNNFIFRPE